MGTSEDHQSPTDTAPRPASPTRAGDDLVPLTDATVASILLANTSANRTVVECGIYSSRSPWFPRQATDDAFTQETAPNLLCDLFPTSAHLEGNVDATNDLSRYVNGTD